jgi:hypothetical protein
VSHVSWAPLGRKNLGATRNCSPDLGLGVESRLLAAGPASAPIHRYDCPGEFTSSFPFFRIRYRSGWVGEAWVDHVPAMAPPR